MIDLAHCQRLDAADRLAPLRAQFDLPEGVIYLDGNSLGALPRAVKPQFPAPRHWSGPVLRQDNRAAVGIWRARTPWMCERNPRIGAGRQPVGDQVRARVDVDRSGVQSETC